MADKAISDLSAATSIQSDDNFVLEQNGTAKRLTGQTLINWLTKAADGHGGIKTIEKLSTNGLTDTYQITLADNTTFDFSVTNGRAISSVKQTGTSGLTRTYTISFNNNTTQKFTVTDGRAITSITETSVNGLTRTYTISFNDGESQTFDVTDGRAITDIVETSANGLTRTYTISFNDKTKKMFTVKDGRGITNVSVAAIGTFKKTYTMHYNDGTSTSFTITDGRSISSIEKSNTDQSTDTDTYTIYFNDDTTETFSVKNGAKGDKGDNTYVWIKYASQQPTEESNSFGDVPDNWIGIYFGSVDEAPSDWRLYSWFRMKGDKGDPGDAATLVSTAVAYQASDSGVIVPSGTWTTSVPLVAQGKFLWTRTTNTFNTGSPVVSYSVSRMGLDGSGSVSSVAGVSPNGDGNVPLKAADVGALPKAGGDMTGELKMSGKPISGLNMPTEEDQAANMGFVNQQMRKASPRNLLDNSDFTNLVAQAGIGGNHGTQAYAADRWILTSGTVSYEKGVGLTLNGTITQKLEWWPASTKSFVECASGTATIKRSNGTVTITSSGGVLKNAACYPGVYTDDEKPNYCPKGYSEELRECLRYYQKTQYAACYGFAFSSQTVYAFWSLPGSMRATPTFVMSDNFQLAVRPNGNQYTVGKEDISLIDWYGYYARIRIRQGSMGISVDTPVMSNIYAGTIEIIADL